MNTDPNAGRGAASTYVTEPGSVTPVPVIAPVLRPIDYNGFVPDEDAEPASIHAELRMIRAAVHAVELRIAGIEGSVKITRQLRNGLVDIDLHR